MLVGALLRFLLEHRLPTLRQIHVLLLLGERQLIHNALTHLLRHRITSAGPRGNDCHLLDSVQCTDRSSAGASMTARSRRSVRDSIAIMPSTFPRPYASSRIVAAAARAPVSYANSI